MASIFGREYSRAEVLRKVGNISQLGGVETVELQDGRAQGVKAVRVRTGPLAFTVLAGNALDIYDFSYMGTSLCWHSPTGIAAGPYFEDEGLRLTRVFQGGLLMTCGLTTMGAPTIDEGEPLGLHGRVHHLPAENFSADGRWDGDEYVMWVEGRVREAAMFGANLVLHRRIETRLGSSSIQIHDTVENEGYASSPHLILYHVNAGFPLVDAGTRLVTNSKATPRDAEAEKGVGHERELSQPMPGFAEQVYWHDVKPDSEGMAMAAVVNDSFAGGAGLALYLRYPKAQLPWLYEWKMMGEGTYVLGVEPANALGYGRAVERAAGRLPSLAPGESVHYDLEIGVATGRAGLAALGGVAR
jgi:hypothetical protein